MIVLNKLYICFVIIILSYAYVTAYERILQTEKIRLGQPISDEKEPSLTERFSEVPAYKAYLTCLIEMAKGKFIHEKTIWEKASEEGLQVEGKTISRVYSRSLLQRLVKQGKAIKGQKLGTWKYNANGMEEVKTESNQ
ncbi:hypothetical protein LCGC14_1149750 [marine sediment metagenome]|uniref:Uncharacterized protein n=1 Tax=marine sediment metagenome TaxID=412755 RepID=A0A0F9MJ10_9ZZZZ